MLSRDDLRIARLKAAMVLVKNVPLINHNGEVYENLHLTSTIEEIIEEEYESLPDSIDFEELLK